MLKSVVVRLFLIFFLSTSAFTSSFAGSATHHVGKASVIDADTIEIHGKRIRLHAIDAPETSQLCRGGGGESYRCGQRAALALADYIVNGIVACEEFGLDRYKRIVAFCSVNETSLNAWLVENGHALAYRRYGLEYVAHEDRAREARRGIWAGEFVPPWAWRRGVRLAEVQATGSTHAQRVNRERKGSDCLIKGNISNNGRIYHIPGSRHYERTKIDTSRGERWFCSVDEAVRAGWRAPRG